MISKKKKSLKRAPLFPIRFTVEEREELARRAGERALGTYIKSVLFADK